MNPLKEKIKDISSHWDHLPKSTFNDEEFLLLHIMEDTYYYFEGYGCDEKGDVYLLIYKSDNCRGRCILEHVAYLAGIDEELFPNEISTILTELIELPDPVEYQDF